MTRTTLNIDDELLQRAAALTGLSHGYDYGATTLGVRGEMPVFAGMPLVARGMLGWQHVFGDVTPAATLAFASAPATTFTVTGAPIARDALVAEAGLDWRVTAATSLGLYYSGTVAGHANDNAVKGRIDVAF